MPQLVAGVILWFTLALFSGVKQGDSSSAVSCEASEPGGTCRHTQREQCISDRDDLVRYLHDCEDPREYEYRKQDFRNSQGKYCPSWNVTADTPHEHTPSFRPENVSLTVEVNSNSNQFRIYAAWDRQDSDLLYGYEVRVIQRSHYDDFKGSSGTKTTCNVTNKTTSHIQTSVLNLDDGEFVKVEVVTSPFEAWSEDCNMYTDMFHIPSSVTGNLTNLHTLCELKVSGITVSSPSAEEVHITWSAPSSSSKLIYFISVTDPEVSSLPNCREQGGNPPCFVTNTTSVTIGPLDLSKNYILNINAFPVCDGYEIMGVYTGCRGECCQNYPINFSAPSTLEPTGILSATSSVLPHPTTVDNMVSSSMDSSISPSFIFSIDHHFKSSSVRLAASSSINTLPETGMYTSSVLPHPTTVGNVVSSSMGPVDISTPSPSFIFSLTSIDHHFNSSSVGLAGSSSVNTLPETIEGLDTPTDKAAVVAAAAVLGATLAVVIVMLVIVTAVVLRRRWKRKDSSINSCSEYEERVCGVDNRSSCNGIQNGKHFSVHTSNTSPSEPASVHENSPSFSDSTEDDSIVRVPKPFPLQTGIPSVLVVYSPRCPADDKHVLLQFLLSDLQSYDIRTTSHDWHLKGNIPMWIEQEVKRSTAVLCVCNQQFQQEWEHQVAADCTVVYALQQLMYALLSQCEDLSSKFAVVLLRQSDRQFIPTQYLQNVKRFYVNEVKEIAHFVKRVPPYECKTPAE